MKTIFSVPEISCSHCEKSIKELVTELDGVQNVVVNIAEKTVIVEHNNKISIDTIKSAIEDAGYEVSPQFEQLSDK